MKFINEDLAEDVKNIPKSSTFRRTKHYNGFFIEVNTGDYETSRFYIYEDKVERDIDYKLLRQIMRLKK